MKLKILLSVMAIIILASPGFSQYDLEEEEAGGTFVAVVDIKLVFKQYSARKKAQKKLFKKKQEFLTDLQKRKNKIDILEKDFESKKESLSQEDYRKSLALIELAKENLNLLVKRQNNKLSLMEKRLKRPIIKKILKTINIIREEYGYDIILNKSDVLSYSDNNDLTNEVLERLEEDENENIE